MIEIIPAMDIIDASCVRLSQGDYSKCTVYSEDPVDMAMKFEDAGAGWIHLVDLDGAKSRKPVNLKTLERVASATSLKVEFGGGIKSGQSVSDVFNAGASRVVCGSIACSAPETFMEWIRKYGGERIVLGADAMNGKVAVNGWNEDSGLSLYELLENYSGTGLKSVIVTDISRDGMLEGPSVDLYSSLISRFPELTVIASGGVGKIDDIVALDRAGVESVIVGKAIYEGKITLGELGKYLVKN